MLDLVSLLAAIEPIQFNNPEKAVAVARGVMDKHAGVIALL